MAIEKSIKGTTSQIADAIAANKIGIETSVTITDNLYDATLLGNIIGKTNKTITLVHTAAGTPIEADATDLVKILAQVNKYTGPLTVTTVTDPNPTAEQLNYIAKKTTGKVTAELVDNTPITKATVDALKDVSSSDNIKFVADPASGLVEGKAALEALVALNKKLSDADWSNISDLKGSASEVAAIKAAIEVVDDATVTNVTITSGQISAADANALVVASDGVVTATIKDGSVAATLKALKDVDPADGDQLTFKSTDKTADAKALVDLADLVIQNFSSVLTITSKAADIGTNGKNVTDALALTSVGDPDVTITNGTISATNAATISAATAGKVTATITPDTAFNIAGALTALVAKDALAVTVNGDTASVANLKIIDAKASKVKVDAAEVTADTFAEFESIYVTGKAGFSNLGDENITIAAGAADMNSAKADIVAKATSKVVTATITGETAASVVTNLKNANAKDALTITVITDPNGTSAKDLIALTKKTSEPITAIAITTHGIVGSVADINAVIKAGADGKLGLNAAVAYSVTGTVKAADANYIALNTTGVVTATIAADTAAKLDAALTDLTVNKYKLTVNGATASVTELNALAAKTSVLADAIKVDAKEITGAGADLVALYANAKFDNLGNENVKVTNDDATLAEIKTVLGKTTGIVTAEVTGTAAALKADLANATAKDKLTLTVTNDVAATAAADLLALDDKTAGKVDAKGITNGITGSAADVKKLLASKGVDVSKTTNITLSDLVVKAADVSSVAKATSGVVTATVTADTAAKLNAALTDKDVNALTLTVNGTTATAKDLISLDGKTSANITLNVGAITGDLAEITKVFTDTDSTFINEDKTAATISGTEIAEDVNAIALLTSGVVTATIAAGTAEALNDALTDATFPLGGNAYKLTVIGNDADAADLVALDGKTSITVNAAAIKNIEGTGLTGATDVKKAYEANALKTISGLGNETVDLTGATDANASLVKAINDYTTGVITLPTITFVTTAATTFNLSQLGDLNGITKLANIEADNGRNDTISISLKDLLAANDSKNNFTFNLNVNTGDLVNVTNDVSGWTKAQTTLNQEYTYTNDKTGQVVTIVADEAVINA